METRRLGRTEHQSSIAILGGAVFFKDSPELANNFSEKLLLLLDDKTFNLFARS